MRTSKYRQAGATAIRRFVFSAVIAFASDAAGQVFSVAELNTRAIQALDRATTVVFLPVGILEQHGPYLPSYADGYATERLTRELAEAVVQREQWQALIFPSIPIGHGGANIIGHKSSFPGTYDVRAETLRALLMDLASDLGEQGFQWVFVVSLHGAPDHHRALDDASDYFTDEYGGKMVNLFGLTSVNEVGAVATSIEPTARAEDGFTVHAGMRETSDLLFLRPDLVSRDYTSARSLTGRHMADLVALASRTDWSGYFGAPRLATAAYGAKSWLAFSDKAKRVLLQILGGADHRRIQRYADVLESDPATVAINNRSRQRDNDSAHRQQEWLRRNRRR